MKQRETVCEYYICKGQCTEHRDACHNGYCQHCDHYKPRAKERHINKKKQERYKYEENEQEY